jgi:hypothetical protein
MTKILTGLSAALLALTLSFGAHAQAEPDAARLSLATEIARAASTEADYRQALDSTMPVVRQMFAASVPGATTEQLDEVVVVMTDILMSTYDDVLAAMANSYAQRFTEAELVELRDFYRTELGQKMIGEMPEIMQEMASLGEQLGEAAVSREIARIQAVFAEPAADDGQADE